MLSTSLPSVDDLVEPAINEDLPDVLELMELSFIELVRTEVGVGSETVVSDQQLEEQSICSSINKSCEIIRQEQPSVSQAPVIQLASQSDNVSTSRPTQFPFVNSSYPGDPDSDVLPYPATAAWRSKRPQKVDKPCFFLLTSQEANEQKQKEKQVKIEKEKQKQE